MSKYILSEEIKNKCRDEHYEDLINFVKAHPEIHPDDYEINLLWLALQEDELEFAVYLLQNGADLFKQPLICYMIF